MKTDFIVRQIAKTNYSTVYHLIQTPFETAEHRDGDEEDFAVRLRNGENYIAELDLVAELNGINHESLPVQYVMTKEL